MRTGIERYSVYKLIGVRSDTRLKAVAYFVFLKVNYLLEYWLTLLTGCNPKNLLNPWQANFLCW
jgi:hypothetical protein